MVEQLSLMGLESPMFTALYSNGDQQVIPFFFFIPLLGSGAVFTCSLKLAFENVLNKRNEILHYVLVLG